MAPSSGETGEKGGTTRKKDIFFYVCVLRVCINFRKLLTCDKTYTLFRIQMVSIGGLFDGGRNTEKKIAHQDLLGDAPWLSFETHYWWGFPWACEVIPMAVVDLETHGMALARQLWATKTSEIMRVVHDMGSLPRNHWKPMGWMTTKTRHRKLQALAVPSQVPCKSQKSPKSPNSNLIPNSYC